MRDSRRHILFIIPDLTAGGAQRVVTTILRKFNRNRFTATLIVVDLKDEVFASALPDDIQLLDLKIKRVRYALPIIVHLLWQIRPDVVFATREHMILALGAVRALWPPNTRFIVRPTILLSAELEQHSHPLLWRELNRICLPKADMVIFQSEEMEQDWRQTLGWFSGTTVVIPNPLDIEFVREQAIDTSVHTQFRSGAFNLVAAGRLEYQKGFDIAIDALSKVRNSKVHLTIVGEGSMRRHLEQQAQSSGIGDRLRFVGFRANPFPYYAQADGFLMSSRFEGFPNVVLEALACTTPVVATPIPGLIRIINKIPQCRLAEAATSRALAEAIDDFVETGRRRVSLNEVDYFDVGSVVAQYEETFRSIMYSQCR
jgi:glycosyltransferase involved in cell wall biosynthesis